MLELINIPEERKAILIGKEGQVKKKIERKTRTKIKISGDIEIQGEPLDIIKAKETIKAIGRGFPPEHALKLLDEDFQLSVIYVRCSPKKMKRLLARVIGRGGSAKKKIEELTGCHICIYGKTISLIGTWEDVEKARKAVEEILEGKPHSNVYHNLTR